jgi:phosphohistidine swiveling domain-containing protein
MARTHPDTIALTGSRKVLVGVASRQLQVREHARDAAMRFTHELRRALREWGRRLAATGVLDDPSDITYLVLDEVRVPPPDARDLVAERRAERERLAARRPPGFLRHGWTPDTTATPEVTVLEGLSASPGVVRGRARVLSDADGLVAGEVLVTEVTDIGWTALFASAAAVVTDLGGAMSHAAVVAREFGLPAVVGTQHATRLLRDGMLIEVDGAAGTVTILDEDALP